MTRHLFFLLLAVIAFNGLAFAGDETRNFRAYGSAIVNSPFIECRDDKFTGSSGWVSGFVNYSNRAVIELGLDEEKHFVHGPFKTCVKFDVELTDASLTTSTLTNQQLDINYEPAELTRYKDKAQLVFYGYYKVKVYNIQMGTCDYSVSCTSTLCTGYVPDDVYLQAEITTNRIYNFTSTTSIGSSYGSLYNSTGNELDIHWNYVPGAEQYELEYTYVDDYTGTTTSSAKAASAITYDLDHDATRIVTPYNFYKLPMNYERGYIVYRIRPVGTSSTNVRMEGAWAGATATGTVSDALTLSAAYAHSASLASDNMNWSAVKTFAELGRTGHGLSYSDALGFTRQTIARNNTDKKNLAQTTLYDHHGRPVINVLPTIVSGANFDYRYNLNRVVNTVSSTINFDKSVYDVTTGTVIPLYPANGFSLAATQSSGAANYYSFKNQNKQGYQAFLPDADSLPYTHIKYKPNGFGLISSQSLPGKTHQLGSGRELKYYYAKPSQVELDRLFGSEAPRAINCYKNVVLDPNGQLTTSYLDLSGKTLATGLLGASPPNLDELPNQSPPVILIDDLSNPPTNVTDNNARCKEVNTSIFISKVNSVEGYTYNATLGSISSPCDSANICFECRYDLTLSIKDETGEEIFSYTLTPPATYTTVIGAAPPYNSVTCIYEPGLGGAPVGNYFSLSSTSIAVTFPKIGVYNIYKKICVNNNPINAYKEIFLETQSCVNECDIFDSLVNQTNFNITAPVTCASCTAQVQQVILENVDTYTRTGSGVLYTPEQISQMYQNCEVLCVTEGSKCDKYKKLLEADFYPGGQYATTNTASPTYSYSVFNPTNMLTGSPTWSAPASPPYLNPIGQNASVTINGVTVPPTSLSISQFTSNFQNSWASSFLTSHPEYCKYYFYCNIVGTSLDYDEKIKNIPHYDSACATNYVMPFNFSPAAGPGTACVGSPLNADPIYSLATTHPSFSTAVSNFTNEIAGNYLGTGNDLFYYSSLSVLGGTALPGGYYFGQDPCTRDQEWALYKNAYLAKKYELYTILSNSFIANPSNYGLTVSCATVPAGFTPHFPNWEDSLQTLFGPVGSPAPLGPYTNTTQLSQVGNSLVVNSQTLIASNCSVACAAYAAQWNQNLWQGCPAYSSSLTSQSTRTNIIAAFEGVCMLGCDGTNQVGASSVATGTTYTIPGSTVTVTDFQGVLDFYLGTNTCNAVVIAQPAPYPTNPLNPAGNALSDCGCDKIFNAQYQFANMSPLPTGVDQEWKMFRYLYGTDLSDYNSLLCACQQAITGNTWTPTFTWSPGQISALDSYSNYPVSSKLKCEDCIVCSDVVTAIATMSTQLLSPTSYTNPLEAITVDSVNYILAINSLNNQFGTHSMNFYAEMYQDCQDYNNPSPPVALTFSNHLHPKSLELYTYLSSLLKKKKMHQDHTTTMCIDHRFYLSSLYTGTFTGGSPNNVSITNYTYDANIVANSLTISITSGTTTFHEVQLTAPVSFTAWSKLKSLSNLKAYCPTPTAGFNYTFVVDAKDVLLTTITLTGQVLSQSIPICNLSTGATPQPQYCKPAPTPKVNAGLLSMLNNIIDQAEIVYTNSITALASAFEHRYKDRCLSGLNETFKRSYEFNTQDYYTLYYYDQAGNLVRTVPPLGVGTGTDSGLLPITEELAITTMSFPVYSSSVAVNNRYVSRYDYNSYNQPLAESTADGGSTVYFYDLFGRIVFSQNARQAALGNVYSYTRYDDLGRIMQVGQVLTSSAVTSTIAENSSVSTITGGTRSEVTSIFYDEAVGTASVLANFTGSVQTHLRNRVAYVTYEDADDSDASTYEKATFYSYDDHGNVKEMVQYNSELEPLNKAFARIAYEYELVSGNMVKATYEPNGPDRFIHKYAYDADNRLHEVFTSKDEQNWDRDAKYFYYEHGPLARVERGDKQVQGMDYYYTIHGWIKGANNDAMLINSDAGKDGAPTNVYLSAYNKVHNYFARDAMSYGLNYYGNAAGVDYKSIGNADYNSTTNMNPVATTSNVSTGTFSLGTDGPGLFNGNISSMATSLLNKDATTNQSLHPVNTPFAQLTAYRYDQLNRITQMKAFSSMTANEWDSPASGNYDGSYFMNFSYDANGNILSLRRDGVGANIKAGLSLYMDDLDYKYKNIANSYGINSNQLAAIKESSVSVYTDDVDAPSTYGTDRYDYDATGNLIRDDGEYIATIEWTVDRKVKKITRDVVALLAAGVTKDDIEYEYDGLRRRVSKIVKPRDATTKLLKNVNHWRYTYYVYDASGNVMATYERSSNLLEGFDYTDKLNLAEHHIFGSSRLGLARPSEDLNWQRTYTVCGLPGEECRDYSGAATAPVASWTNTTRKLGYKEFELTNHLGNVIATVSDRKVQLIRCVLTRDVINGIDNYTDADTTFTDYTTVNSTTVLSNNALAVTPTVAFGGVNREFSETVAGNEYILAFSVEMNSTTLTDSLYAKVYGYTSATGVRGLDSAYILITQSGRYEINFTAQPEVTNFMLYYNSGANVSASPTHSFTLNKPALYDPPPVMPETPANAINQYANINCGYGWSTPDNIVYYYGYQLVNYYPDLLMHTDYYAFGQQMPGRTWYGTADQYRYAMNTQETEKEIFSGAQSAEYWMYDARLGRRWEMDPVIDPSVSPYTTFYNNPIYFSDLLGATAGTNNPNGSGAKTKDQLTQESMDEMNKNCPGCYIMKDGVITNNPNAPVKDNPGRNTTPTPAPKESTDATISQGDSPAVAKQKKALDAFLSYGGDGSGSFKDWGMWTLDKIRVFSPLTQLSDAANIALWGKDSRGIPKGTVDLGFSLLASIPLTSLETALIKPAAVEPFMVGTYSELKSFSKVGDNLDIHHAGQAHVFEQIIPGYSRKNAPAIALPKALHSMIPNSKGIIDILPRAQLAKDALNLRSIGVPSQSILKVIELNKRMYPKAFKK